MTVITQEGEFVAGHLEQIDLGLFRAAKLGPDDVLVIQTPEGWAPEDGIRLEEYLKARIADLRVVIVGPGVVFGILNTDPEPDRYTGLDVGAELIERMATAERALRMSANTIEDAIEWAGIEIVKSGLIHWADEIGRIRVAFEGPDVMADG